MSLALLLAAGCVPTEGRCATDLATTGSLVVDLEGEDVECFGSSDNLDTFVDLSFQFETTIIDIELDDLVAGETGEYTALVAIDDRDNSWRGECPLSIDEHALLGGSIWELRAEVRCATLPAGFDNGSAEDLVINGGSFVVEGWHSRYEY